MEERAAKKPVIVSGDGIRKIDRIQMLSKDFQEEWLQDILAKEPSILPTASIDSVYAPLLCIGREVAVTSGSIDNLYISPKGYIVIVETKLWRNPEARREVVGQIIDYAKDLKEWDYEQLNNAYKKINNCNTGIFEAMVSHNLQAEDNEAAFIDMTEKNMKQSRFLLMIVGDGIREGVEKMAEFLNETPNMQYRLALCELEVYDLGNGERLVIPQLTTKTNVIERGIIRVEGTTSSVSIIMHEDKEQDDASPRKASSPKDKLSPEEWFEKSASTNSHSAYIKDLIEDFAGLDYIYYAGTSDLSVAYRFESLKKKLQVLMLWGDGSNICFQPHTFYSFLEKYGYSRTIAESLMEKLRKFLIADQKNKPYEKEEGYYFIDIKKVLGDRDEFLQIFEEFKSNF